MNKRQEPVEEIKDGDFIQNIYTNEIDKCITILKDGMMCVEFKSGFRSILHKEHYKKVKKNTKSMTQEEKKIKNGTEYFWNHLNRVPLVTDYHVTVQECWKLMFEYAKSDAAKEYHTKGMYSEEEVLLLLKNYELSCCEGMTFPAEDYFEQTKRNKCLN